MREILFLGDLSWDETYKVPDFPAPDEKVIASDIVEGFGGVAANSAVAAARAGAMVAFMGVIGSDIASARFADHMASHGIRPILTRKQGTLCRVASIVEPHGEKRLVLYPGVSFYPDIADLTALDLNGISHIHTAIYGTAGFPLIDMARAAGMPWSLDLEPATFPQGIAQLAPAVTGSAVVFANDRAAAAIGENPVSRLFDMGAQAVVRTRGAQGAEYHEPDTRVTVPAPSGHPIRDTTGAGDCLAGWYLARRADGLPPEAALRDAVLAATLACASEGAQSGYPTLQDLNAEKAKKAK